MNAIKIEVRTEKNVPNCGDGCCHDDGLMIDKIIDGKSDDYFIATENDKENLKVVELLEFLFGEENVCWKNETRYYKKNENLQRQKEQTGS